MTEKKRVAPAAGMYLPPELISDILPLIPFKSIGRFRCVCKQWLTILSDRQLLNRQFHLNNLQTTKKVVFMHNSSSFVSINFRDNGGAPVLIYETLKFNPCSCSSYSNVKSKYKILGSCNGLLLLHHSYEGGSELFIVNPITCESRQLPPLPPLPGNTKNYPSILVFGFGYCSYDDDYVVVIPVMPFRPSRPGAYVLRRNKWETIENFPSLLDHRGGAFVNEAIHYVGFDLLNRSKRIIYAFDLAAGDNCFRVLELPEGLKNKINRFRLCVLGGCLCLVTERNDPKTYTCEVDIWVMKEYGVRDSWTKYLAYTSCIHNFYLMPLFFWNGNESIVGLRLDEPRPVFCCLTQNTSTLIQLIEEKRFPEKNIWTFTDSLFSPNSSNAGTRNEV